MARRNDHSREELHALALDAAQAIVVEEGYDKLSARKIATRMGYTQGTLYLVFHNLDDLIVQLNARTFDELYAALHAIAQDRARPPDWTTVRALGRAYLAFAEQHTQRWRLIFDHRLPYEDTPAWFQAKVQQGFAMVEGLLAEVAQGHSKKEIKLAARALWGGVHGVCMLALTGNLVETEQGSTRKLVDSLIECYLKGFAVG